MNIQPPSILLTGPSGSGKTSSIATMVKAGIETFVVVTEPDGVASLVDSCERISAPIEKLHWMECRPKSTGFTDLDDMVTKINTMDQKQLSDQRDMGKAGFRAAASAFVGSMKDFKCDRTGTSYGDVTKWDDTRALAWDSLTGISMIAWGATVGYKPTANPGEWGIAQNFVHNLVLKINMDRKCYFILTSHIEKEMDELSGIKKVMVSTIGSKLAPKIPVMFSEVVLCSRKQDSGFLWSTIDNSMDLKNRALPVGAKLLPDFAPIVSAHERRKKLAGATQTPPANPQPAEPKPGLVIPAAASSSASLKGLTR